MAVTKNPLTRYKILDSCFRNPGKRYFIDGLIAECNKVLIEIDPRSTGISRRQVLDDIAFMESAEGWNIELVRLRVNRRVFYRYANTDYSINNMPLNETEIDQLQSAMQVLAQFQGMPQFEWVNELLPKLQQGIQQSDQKPIMSFDSNPYLKGIDQLGVLYNAIRYEKVLKITYQDFKSATPYPITIHPYFLKQYNNRWFLFGYNPEKDKSDWNLAVDRIAAIDEADVQYRRNSLIDWEEYFDDIIGVTKPVEAKIEDIVLHFYGVTGKYIDTKPLHGSQKARWLSDDVLEVRLQLMLNYELERLILSYAQDVKVLAPSDLATRIKTRLSEAITLYNTP